MVLKFYDQNHLDGSLKQFWVQQVWDGAQEFVSDSFPGDAEYYILRTTAIQERELYFMQWFSNLNMHANLLGLLKEKYKVLDSHRSKSIVLGPGISIF